MVRCAGVIQWCRLAGGGAKVGTVVGMVVGGP